MPSPRISPNSLYTQSDISRTRIHMSEPATPVASQAPAPAPTAPAQAPAPTAPASSPAPTAPAKRRGPPKLLIILVILAAVGYGVWKMFLQPAPAPEGVVQVSGRIE